MEHPMRQWSKARLLALFLVLVTTPAAAREYDWCSSVAVRPDQYFRDKATCANSFSDTEIGAGADAVLVGDFTDVASPVVAAPARTCAPTPSHATNAAYVQRLRTARASAGGAPLEIVHMHRFELVPFTLAAQPQFSPVHLLRTARTFPEVTGFFSSDRSAPCLARACRWTDSYAGLEGRDAGRRLRDFVDAKGGTGSHQSAVYYLARPDGTGVYYPTSAMADLRSPAYRAWRVQEARNALLVGGYDSVDLNHKLHQYLFGPHWIQSTTVPDVAALDARADTFWSAPPTGYGYSEYVQGWYALAVDLRAARVPYSVTIALRAWLGSSFDDKSTPAVDEAALIRAVMMGARLVLLDYERASTPQVTLDQARREIEAYGPRVIPIDQTCGLRIEKPLPPPAPPTLER
ncbi:MAG: hypothetical protein IT386_14825 [Deltaproteobacteria bacterium]|nr:hypothetical protein [Deltaproteobacteria bacterium]